MFRHLAKGNVRVLGWPLGRRGAADLSDGQLLECFAGRRGETAEQALEALIARHGPMVLGVCRHLLRNPHDADDAFQATFLVLVRKAGSLRVNDSLGNWLYGVAQRVARHARAVDERRRTHEARAAALAPLQSPALADWFDLRPIVHEELSRLPLEYRAPIVLCYLEGLSHDEAAHQLGWPLGTVKGRLVRARDLLRGRLARRGLALSVALLLAALRTETARAAVPESLRQGVIRAASGLPEAAACSSGASAVAAAAPSLALRAVGYLSTKAAASALIAIGVVAAVAAAPFGMSGSPRALGSSESRNPPGATARKAEVGAEGSTALASTNIPEPAAESNRNTPRLAKALEPTAALQAYRDARAKVGRDADAHVRLALWCEASGLEAERLKHLALAVLTNPAHATARGLLGLVSFEGRWQRPEAVAQAVQADAALAAALAEYQAKRAKAPATADGHWKLGLWCEQKGLAAEALAHFTAVTRLEPNREAAWKRLRCRKLGGRWLNDEQIAAERAEAEAQRVADRRWQPRLEKWRGWLADKDHHAEAQRALSAVTDPLAVPSIWAVFGFGNAAQQTLAVQLFGQIDSGRASRALATLAVFSNSAEVRRIATETLLRRDPREFVGPLIMRMYDGLKYEVKPVGGPGSPGVLFVAGEQFNVQRLYAPPPLPAVPLDFGGTLELDEQGKPVLWVNTGPYLVSNELEVLALNGAAIGLRLSTSAMLELWGPNSGMRLLPAALLGNRYRPPTRLSTEGERQIRVPIGKMVEELQKTAAIARQQLQGDIQAIEQHNLLRAQANAPVLEVLAHFGPSNLKGLREDWLRWWTNEQGYGYSPPSKTKPTVVEDVPLLYRPQPVEGYIFDSLVGYTPLPRTSCFAAGTVVFTLEGPLPIESLGVGDRILAQDTDTGALNYQPIVAVYHNPPSATLRINLEGDSIVATGIHRFWKPGIGWVMARELKAGDTVRTYEGTARIVSVEPERVQRVYNLEVAANATFFVGKAGALVHDNTLVSPVAAAFDASALPRREGRPAE